VAASRPRAGLLTAGGVLAIIAGVSSALWGIGLSIAGVNLTGLILHPVDFFEIVIRHWPFIVGRIITLGLSILAIVGGVVALKRTSWGLALTGGICSLLVGGVLGILALIFIAVSRDQFP